MKNGTTTYNGLKKLAKNKVIWGLAATTAAAAAVGAKKRKKKKPSPYDLYDGTE